MRRNFKNELKSYFGLSQAQTDTAGSKWNTKFNDQIKTIYSLPPTNYNDAQGVAYWQWAAAYITNNSAPFEIPSVSIITDTVAGYPELSFFKDTYFMPNISKENKDRFESINLYKTM